METECKFTTTADHFLFSTQVNGDNITLSNLVLSQEQATALTWLINKGSGTNLSVEIKLDQ